MTTSLEYSPDYWISGTPGVLDPVEIILDRMIQVTYLDGDTGEDIQG